MSQQNRRLWKHIFHDHKPEDARVLRETWLVNGCTYEAYRKYIRHAKQVGFPEQRAVGYAPSVSEWSESQLTPTHYGSGWTTALFKSLEFSGIHCISEVKGHGTHVAFANLSVETLAVATRDGELWVVRYPANAEDGTARSLQMDGKHEGEVKDLTWSRSDAWIVSAGVDGCVRVWSAAVGKCVRTIDVGCAALCARFHPINENILIVGTEAGQLLAYNCSTGVQMHKLQLHRVRSTVPKPTVLLMPGMNVVVGTDVGAIVTFRCDMTSSTFEFKQLASTLLPDAAAVGSLQLCSFSFICDGPALLVHQPRCSISILKDALDGHYNVVKSFSKLPVISSNEVVFAPEHPPYGSICVTVGLANANVALLDLTSPVTKSPVSVSEMQGHSAKVMSVCWSYNGEFAASTGEDGLVIVWRRTLDTHLKSARF